MTGYLKAPRVQHWMEILDDGKAVFNQDTEEIIERIFELVRNVAPCSERGQRELWLKAERGTPEDFDDYEQLKEDEVVNSYEEYLALWKEYYPDEINWFRLVTIEDSDKDHFRAIILGRKLIYQSHVPDGYIFEADGMNDFFLWMEQAVRKCIEGIRNGTYNRDIQENLSYKFRSGTISRKDYWDVFPEEKASYFKDISESEIQDFVTYIRDQTDDQPVGDYISEMTAGKFYQYCSLGYQANHYKNTEVLTAKQQYYRFADGRDDGLSEIDPDSAEAFDAWYNDVHRWGGHPWEVCMGGNSTHISLYVEHDCNGYYLTLAGKSRIRSIETIRFYNALRKAGVAVYLCDAKGITDRLLGKDVIGILPEYVVPAYCEGYFPGLEILDFMNLPFEKEYAEAMIPKIRWIAMKEQKLLSVG